MHNMMQPAEGDHDISQTLSPPLSLSLSVKATVVRINDTVKEKNNKRLFL
jgi:hypothetical protein